MPEERAPHESFDDYRTRRMAETQQEQVAREVAELKKQAEDRATSDIPKEPGDEATRANIAAAGSSLAAQSVRATANQALDSIRMTTNVPPQHARMPGETDIDYLTRMLHLGIAVTITPVVP